MADVPFSHRVFDVWLAEDHPTLNPCIHTAFYEEPSRYKFFANVNVPTTDSWFAVTLLYEQGLDNVIKGIVVDWEEDDYELRVILSNETHGHPLSPMKLLCNKSSTLPFRCGFFLWMWCYLVHRGESMSENLANAFGGNIMSLPKYTKSLNRKALRDMFSINGVIRCPGKDPVDPLDSRFNPGAWWNLTNMEEPSRWSQIALS